MGVYCSVALNDNCVTSAAEAFVAASVRMRIPIRSPAATTSGPAAKLVAARNVPAVITVLGDPNLTEDVNGVVTYGAAM